MKKNIFNSVAINKPKTNAFDLSHERKFSMDMGNLIPIFCQEAVPGDKFRVNTEVLMRFAPMLAPVMHRINIFTHYFFVPNRLIWDEWEKFLNGGQNGQLQVVAPYVEIKHGQSENADLFRPGTLPDYLGYPTTENWNDSYDPLKVSVLPLRAYQLIYDQYYRDQNLQDSLFGEDDVIAPQISKSSGAVTDLTALSTLCALRKRCWEKDYFTSALPWSQRGGAVHLPLTGDAEVKMVDGFVSSGQHGTFDSAGAQHLPNDVIYNSPDGVNPDGTRRGEIVGGFASQKFTYNPQGSLYADMSTVTMATINDLRRATRLQQWLERSAVGGGRYKEMILSQFGVVSPDARLQRAEYLGGGKSPVVISEVLQTSASEETSAQGNMAGHGLGVGNTHQFAHSFTEHGYVIGVMSVLPRTAYQQGCPRSLTRFDKFDYLWPIFANLGEQEVKNKELFVGADNVDNEETFGYQSRYSEYKYCPSTVHGDFKTNLSYWHLGRIFSALPTLSPEFVQATDSTMKRIFNVDDPAVASLYVQVYHNFQAIRPLPYFGTPTL